MCILKLFKKKNHEFYCAEQARKKTQKREKAVTDMVLPSVFNTINHAIKNGEYSCTYSQIYNKISEHTVSELKILGYQVKRNLKADKKSVDEYSIIISW